MSDRETPFDIVFRRGGIDFDARFDEARAEAEARGMDVDDPERFVMLGAVGALLREMILSEEAADEAGELWQAVPADAIAQTGALLYQAYRFREGGSRVFTTDEAAARALVATAAEGSAARGGSEGSAAADAGAGSAAVEPTERPAPGGRVHAGYVQLPRNLFWARPDENAPAEPVDGFFFAAGWRFDVLLALGVRPRRPGFTAIPLALDVDSPTVLERWAATKTRERGDDFANILPGGDIEKLYGLTSAAEAIRLVALALRHLGVVPVHG